MRFMFKKPDSKPIMTRSEFVRRAECDDYRCPICGRFEDRYLKPGVMFNDTENDAWGVWCDCGWFLADATQGEGLNEARWTFTRIACDALGWKRWPTDTHMAIVEKERAELVAFNESAEADE